MAIDVTNRSATMDAAVDMLKAMDKKLSPQEMVALTFLLNQASEAMEMWRGRYVELADAVGLMMTTEMVQEQLRGAPGIAIMVPVDELYLLRDAANKRKSYERTT
jgi:hypothetical protein